MKTTLTKKELKDEIIEAINRNLIKQNLEKIYLIIAITSKYENAVRGKCELTDCEIERFRAINNVFISEGQLKKVNDYASTIKYRLGGK